MTALPTTNLIRDRLSDAALQRAFGYFAVREPDRAEFASAAARIRADRDKLTDVAETVAVLRGGMGQPLAWGEPFLPAVFDPQDPNEPVEARFFYPVVCAAMLPDTLAFHRTRAIPDQASRAVLADLGRHLRIFEKTFGHTGMHEQNWLSLHLRGVIFDFGRLQANLQSLGDGVVTGVHIPDSGPLHPADVDASLRRIRPFFARHFPEFDPLTTAVCDSWLLDEQLLDLVPSSNIARFCARWEPIGEPQDGDESVRNFVFRRPYADPAQLTGTTRLETALLAHWAAGGHLHTRMGRLELPNTVPSVA